MSRRPQTISKIFFLRLNFFFFLLSRLQDDFIQAHNAKKDATYTLGHNQFSHLSLDEWKEYVHLGLSKPEPTTLPSDVLTAPANLMSLPASIDWTTKGGVTGVKDQGQCGSCWSFSATGALEGAYYNKLGKLESFSEQNFVSCDNRSTGGKDKGCSGGLMDNAFDWAAKNGGVCTEAAYPYTSGVSKENGDCITTCSKVAAVAPKSHTDVQTNSDSAMMTALAKQPVAIAIEADQKAFQLYKSGVFTEACGTKLDHGVLAVGYGTLNGQDYYKVKNRYGPLPPSPHPPRPRLRLVCMHPFPFPRLIPPIPFFLSF